MGSGVSTYFRKPNPDSLNSPYLPQITNEIPASLDGNPDQLDETPRQLDEIPGPLQDEKKMKIDDINEIIDNITILDKEVNMSLEIESEEDLKEHHETCENLFDNIDALQNSNKKANYKPAYRQLGEIDKKINIAIADLFKKNKGKESKFNYLNLIEQNTENDCIETNSETIMYEQNDPNISDALKRKQLDQNIDHCKKRKDETTEENFHKVSDNKIILSQVEKNLKKIKNSVHTFLGLPTDNEFLRLESMIEDILKDLKVLKTNDDTETVKETQTNLMNEVKDTLRILRQRSYDLEAIEKYESTISVIKNNVEENIDRFTDYEKEDIEEDLYQIKEKLDRTTVIEELQERRSTCLEQIEIIFEILQSTDEQF